MGAERRRCFGSSSVMDASLTSARFAYALSPKRLCVPIASEAEVASIWAGQDPETLGAHSTTPGNCQLIAWKEVKRLVIEYFLGRASMTEWKPGWWARALRGTGSWVLSTSEGRLQVRGIRRDVDADVLDILGLHAHEGSKRIVIVMAQGAELVRIKRARAPNDWASVVNSSPGQK